MADLTIKCARQILWSLREIEATLTEQLDLERARAEKAEADRDKEAHYFTVCNERLSLEIEMHSATKARAEEAEAIVRSVQAELLAGGSLARLRAIVGINNQEDSHA